MQIARSVAVLFLSGISFLLAQQESISLPRSLSIDSITVAGSGTRQALVNVIVEFVEEPLFIARIKTSGNLRTVSSDFYINRFRQFSTDVTAIRAGIGAATASGKARCFSKSATPAAATWRYA